MIRAEKMILRKTDEVARWFEESTAIYNQALYYLRQEFFSAKKENRTPDYSNINLYNLLKDNECWKTATIDHPSKSYVLRKVNDNWKSFYKACKAYWKDKSKFKTAPKIPGYLKQGRVAQLIFDKSRLRHKNEVDNTFSLPKSKFKIQLPNHVKISQIRCITIIAYYGKVKLSVSYDKNQIIPKLNYNNCLGIDIGVDNIIAATTNNHNSSMIVKGGCVKSINQFYNKELARLKSVLETVNKTKTSKRLQRLHMKRKQKLDYEFHCISRKLINYCLDNDIGTIVVGHNNGWKQNCNLGKRNNQKFVQIPFNDLIWKLHYKAEENGIECKIVEESYTSKIDHLGCEELKHQEKYMGNRKERGLFESSCGKILNADINGAIGIMRKANVFSDVDLINLRNRGDVVSPFVLKYKQ